MARGIHTEKFDVFALTPGMYVSNLDIPWSATHYPIKGFMIERQEQIDELLKLCRYVYIDRIRSTQYRTPRLKMQSVESPMSAQAYKVVARRGITKAQVSSRINAMATHKYPVSSKLEQEIQVAEIIVEQAGNQLADLLRGRTELDDHEVERLENLSARMVSSAIRNPEALIWICKIKSANRRIYDSLLASAVTGIVFARHLGLAREKMEVLCQSIMLRGIGLVKLPKKVLFSHQPGKESAQYLQHVDMTIAELKRFNCCSGLVLNTIQNSFERFDGEGYPAKKSAIRIPLLAQMMAVVNFYEASINHFDNTKTLAPAKAVSRLFESANVVFSKQLVEQFVHSIGLYPVGSVVRLSDNSLALVIKQQPNERLRPRVAIIKDATTGYLDKPVVISLADSQQNENSLSVKYGLPRSVVPEEYLSIDVMSVCKTPLLNKIVDKITDFLQAWLNPDIKLGQ